MRSTHYRGTVTLLHTEAQYTTAVYIDKEDVLSGQYTHRASNTNKHHAMCARGTAPFRFQIVGHSPLATATVGRDVGLVFAAFAVKCPILATMSIHCTAYLRHAYPSTQLPTCRTRGRGNATPTPHAVTTRDTPSSTTCVLHCYSPVVL